MVQKEVGWVTGLGADNIWSLDRITAEEYRLDNISFDIINEIRETYKVQTNDIVVPFHSVELDGEASGVSSLIREFSTKSHSGESNKGRRLFSNSRQKVGFLALLLVTIAVQVIWAREAYSELSDLLGTLEISKSTGATRMNHA